jgi:Zn-dependent protease with chaperone function
VESGRMNYKIPARLVFGLLFLSKVVSVIPFIFLLAVLFYLDYAVIFQSPIEMVLVPTTFIITVIFLLVSIYGLFLASKLLINPTGYLLQNSKVRYPNEKSDGRILKAARETGLTATIGLAQGIKSALSFGLLQRKAIVLFPDRLVDALDYDELETLVLHESFHVQHDVETRSSLLIIDYLTQKPIPVITLALADLGVLGLLILDFLFSGAYALLRNLPSELVLLSTPLLFGVICLLMIIILVFIFLFLVQGSFISSRYLYISELLADAYALCMTKKPAKLSSLLDKAGEYSLFTSTASNVFANIGFVNAAYVHHEEENSSNGLSLQKTLREATRPILLSDILHTEKDYPILKDARKKEEILYRKKLIEIMSCIINNHLHLIVNEDRLASPIPSRLASMPPIAFSHITTNKETYMRFLDYARQKQDNFDLVECSKSLGAALFDTFLFLFAAVNTCVIDIALEQVVNQNENSPKRRQG